MYEDNCPIRFLSLHVKLRQCVELGILKEVKTYHCGFGIGTHKTYNGNRIKIRRKVRGVPRWDHGVPYGLYFKEPQDVAYDPETNTLITWAPAL